MAIRVDAYMTGGIASGTVDRAGQLRDLLETSTELTPGRDDLAGARRRCATGRPVTSTLPIDDSSSSSSDDEPSIAMHAAWHTSSSIVGPYASHGELPTLPGFDPGRALTRPSGEFVMLRDVRLGLVGDVDETGVSVGARPDQSLRRSTASRADIMLGFFFPGAAMDESDAPSAAGAVAEPADVARPSTDRRPLRAGPATPAAPGPARRRTGLRWAWCSGARPGVTGAHRQAVAPRPSGRGRTHPRPSTGSPRLSIRWMPRSRSTSSMHTSEMASPVAPARPVRPIRWM